MLLWCLLIFYTISFRHHLFSVSLVLTIMFCFWMITLISYGQFLQVLNHKFLKSSHLSLIKFKHNFCKKLNVFNVITSVSKTLHCLIDFMMTMVFFSGSLILILLLKNAKAERKIWTINNMICILLSHSFIHSSIVFASCPSNGHLSPYIHPQKALSNRSPTQFLYHRNPVYMH